MLHLYGEKMARNVDFRVWFGPVVLGLLMTVAATQKWPHRRYCPCICARLSSPELTYALGPGLYKQVDCRYRNVNDVPSSIPRDTQVLLLNHNYIRNISDNIDYLYELRYLDVSHNQLSGLYRDDVRGNRKLSFINLGSNQLTYIAPNAFKPMIGLKHLIAPNNKMSYIPDAVTNLSSLAILDLSKNAIEGVYTNSLRGLPSLQFLNLQENRIGPVQIGAFYQVPQLINLHLNDNMISYLPSQVFNGLSFLEVLALNSNLIQSLYPGVFHSISNIKTIDLHGNRIHYLDRATFHGLGYLESLYLNSNDLRNLPATLFQGLYNLHTLDLSGNPQIGALPYGLLYGLNNLRSLSLSHAQSVPQTLFSGLASMQSLRVSDSRLPTVTPTLFSDLSRLQILELPHNNIVTLQSHAFSRLWTLTTLDLSDNMIKLMTGAPFYGTSFSALTTLHLQNNAIDKLEDGAFANMPQLQELRLDNNNIPIVPNGVFSWRTRLRSITLDNNQIHTIEEGAVRAMNYVDRLTVVSNYLSCDCHLIGFAKWFQQHWQSVERANEVYCYAPEKYNNRRLIDLINGPTNPFVCVFPRISTEPKVANLTKAVGENVYLHCHIIPTAVATLTWVFPNQQEMDAPSFPPLMNQTLKALANHYGTLILYNIQKKDAGSYKCKATNTVGVDTIVYHIVVVDWLPATPAPPAGGGPGSGGTGTGGTGGSGGTGGGGHGTPGQPGVPPATTPVPPSPGDGATVNPTQPVGHPTPRGDRPGHGPGSANDTGIVCHPNPCQNGGKCSEEVSAVKSEEKTSRMRRDSDEYVQQAVVYHARCVCRQNYGGNLCQYRKPNTPKDVTVIASNKDYISLTWQGTDLENVQGYRVLYSIVGERTIIKSVPIHPTVKSYTMEGLEKDVSYRICVVAFNQGGESALGSNNCIWGETQKAAERTNSIFNMQLVTIGGSCLAVVVILLLIGYAYQKLRERRSSQDEFDESIAMRANRSRTSSVPHLLRKSLRNPMTGNSSFYRNSDDVMLIDLQGYPERQMYMNPMDARQSMHLGDGPIRDFVPGEPDLFPKGNKRKTLKIQDTSM